MAWQKLIADTNGGALMLPPFWTGSWMYREYQKWIRVENEPGASMIWVLYPLRKGSEAPTITIENGVVRVILEDEKDEILIAEKAGVSVRRGDLTTILAE